MTLPFGVTPPGPVVHLQGAESPQSTTLLSDGFEGAFPGSVWHLYHPASGAANVDWGKTSYRKSSGNYSIYCAQSGSDAGGHIVPGNTHSWVYAGPFDLSQFTSGTLRFDLWLQTEQADTFSWLFSFDGQNFQGYSTYDNLSQFTTVEQDLGDWGSAGSALGHSQVWFAFVYDSDEFDTYEGAYLDNVSLTVGTGSSCTVSCTATVPATATVGVPVQFHASATLSGCSGQADYYWYPDTSTTAVINQQSPTVTYDAPGTYHWQLVVETSDGASCEKTGTITVTNGGGGGCSVTCSATVPTTATVGVPVQFRASATLSGCTGQPEYYWFPDANSTATIREQNPIVTYDQPGTYIWEMDVETSDGVGCSKTGTITVTSGGGGGPGVPGAPGVTNGWIPVVIRGTGTNGAVWISDVSILNTGSGSTTVTVTIQTSSGPVTRTFTLPPWGQKLIQDIVNWLIPGGNATGPVNITSTQPVVVSTRVYNRFGSTAACLPNGTLGQSLGIWTIQNALANGKTALLTGLIQTSSYRTNIGLTNLSNASAVVQVELYDEHGNRVAVRSINLDPHQWTQANKPFDKWAGLSNVHGGSAVITVTSGSGVVAYGSVIDNITNDPTTIHMLKFQ